MKIHSSSLASIPARYKTNKIGKPQEFNTEKKENSPATKQPIPIEAKQNTTRILHISKPLLNSPVNTRTHQALNAYIQENKQPTKAAPELVSGIDLFV